MVWEAVELNQRIRKAIREIENDAFWKALYFILRCVWPALRALRLGDSNKPGMHMIYYLSHLTSVHINKSAAEFKNSSEALFLSGMDDDDSDLSEGDSTDEEQEELWEEEDEEECESSDSDDDNHESLVRSIHDQHITTKIAAVWRHRKKKFNSNYAITGWILSTIPQIQEDVLARMKGWHRDSNEHVITKLYAHDIDVDIGTICDTFWNEFKHFQQKIGVFASPARWNTADAVNGKSHLWHEKYSRPWTDVLGHVACIVTSKRLVIGSAERAWKDVKHIKSGYASHIKAERTEKQSMIYTSARVDEVRVMAESMENATGHRVIAWTDNDTTFDLQLEKFGIETIALSTIVIPKRRFCC